MNFRQLFCGFVAILCFAAVAPAFATSANVTVGTGGAGMSFSPSTVTINKGETVTFTYAGGGIAGAHDVHADDNSFRCAKGCDGDGHGGNGNLSSAAWTSTVTFNTAGSFRYYCENHGGPGGQGMSGTVVVNDVVVTPPPGQNINGGISGNWFDPTPNKGGHGFQIEILPNNGILVIWFVFNPAGTTQNWIYTQGSYDPTKSTVTIPAFLEQGGAFPPNFDSTKLTAPSWGDLTLNFTDCNNGSASWKSNATSLAAGYADVTFPIQRLTNIDGTTCP